MAPQYLTCPLCGFEFDRGDTLCEHGCPLGSMCSLHRCPSCAHEFPETPRTVSWVKSLLTRRAARQPDYPEGVQALRDLKHGERARVLCLGAQRAARNGSLVVFGLEPGAEITLLQHRPSCVVQVDETVLALDSEIAREIMVEPVASNHEKTRDRVRGTKAIDG